MSHGEYEDRAIEAIYDNNQSTEAGIIYALLNLAEAIHRLRDALHRL